MKGGEARRGTRGGWTRKDGAEDEEERTANAPNTSRRLRRAQLGTGPPTRREVGELGLGAADGENGESEEGGEGLHVGGFEVRVGEGVW